MVTTPSMTRGRVTAGRNPLIEAGQDGFLPPLPDCSSPCNDPLNMTCLQSDPGAGTPKQNIGAETVAGTGEACDGSHPCVATGATCASPATCAAIPALASTYECNVSKKCTSNTCNLSGLAGVCQ